MFEAEMSSDSLQLAGMAERGMLPKVCMRDLRPSLRSNLSKVLAERNKHGTPTYGILLNCVGALCLGSPPYRWRTRACTSCHHAGYLSFRQVLELLNLLYCISQFIEFAGTTLLH
jgi:hypothetical protein